MTAVLIEKIKIPPLEPGTPSTVRKCSQCKARIKIPLSLFNKLLECPFCHQGILFKSRIDQAKETAGCLGGCLIPLVALGALTLISGYIERPPWRYGWSPVVTPSKVNESAPDAIALTEQAIAAVAAEKEALGKQQGLLEKAASLAPVNSARVGEQVKVLQFRQDELALKQRALEDLLAELRQKALQGGN